QTRRAILFERLALMRQEWRLNEKYRVLMEPALTALDQYERHYLTHWVHSFEADLESFRLTVVCGRLLDLLHFPAHADTISTLGLADLPQDPAALRAHLIDFIDARGVGYPPGPRIEGLFEIYLRLRLLEDEELRARWDVNQVWLERYLPPPGALGVAHARFYHLAHHESSRAGIPQLGHAA
ncbi:MAG: hypothetical protein AAGJ70_11465, partial [Pseudomonadota bacterium]